MRRCDVVVIGGGAMGSSAARCLARRGADVVVLEQFEQGHVRGGSHGATRIFRLAYDASDYVAMARDSLTLWRELEEDTGLSLLEQTGAIDHGNDAVVRTIEDALRKNGLAAEKISAAEARDRWPGMRFDGDVLFQPDGGRLYAERAVRALQDDATAHGAEMRFDEGRCAVRLHDDGMLATSLSGEVSAPATIVAAGSWTPAVLSGIVSLPAISVTKELPAHFAPRDDALRWPSFIQLKGRAPFETYGLSTPGEGVKVAEHRTGAVVDPDTRDFAIDAERLRRLCDYVAEWFPGLDPDPVSVTTCLYDSTATEDFVLDRSGPIVVGAGFSGHGFKFVPLVGRLLADLAAGGPRLSSRFRLP